MEVPNFSVAAIHSATTRGNYSRRLPLPTLTHREIRIMAAHHRANKKTMETVYRVYRLPYPGDPRNLYSDWHRFAGARIPKNGRSTTGSMMALAGVPTVVIKDFLGHSSVVVTERYYTNTIAALRKAAEARAACQSTKSGEKK
jgi:integrase